MHVLITIQYIIAHIRLKVTVNRGRTHCADAKIRGLPASCLRFVRVSPAIYSRSKRDQHLPCS